MKLIRCNDCKTFHSVNISATCMCFCGHCYFCVASWKKKPNKDNTKMLVVDSKVIWVHGPCSVWYLSPDTIKNARPGDIAQIQLMREPHPNIKRVDKGTILFKDQPDLLRKAKGLED